MDWIKVILLHIIYFVYYSLKLAFGIILKYILPILIPVFIVAIIAIKFQWKNLSVNIFIGIAFLIMLFVPSLLCKIFPPKDILGTMPELRFLSVMFAVSAAVLLRLIFYGDFANKFFSIFK